MTDGNWHIDDRSGLTLTGTRRGIDELRALAKRAGIATSWGDSSAPGGFFVRFDMGARGSSLSPDAPPEGGGLDRPAPAGSGRCPECGRPRGATLERHAHWCSRSGLAQKPAEGDIGDGPWVVTDIYGTRFRGWSWSVDANGLLTLRAADPCYPMPGPDIDANDRNPWRGVGAVVGEWTLTGRVSLLHEGYPPVP